MKDEDIKLPEMVNLTMHEDWHNAIEEYARQAVRMNSGSLARKEQEVAWWAVVKALDVVSPGWILHRGSAMDLAVKTILDLGAKAAAATPKSSDPEPFDLARAMAGEPIVTRDGRKARFVAHVPEAKTQKFVAFVDGQGLATSFSESGHFNHPDHEHFLDLFMAPKPKRTVWVNVWCLGGDVGGGVHASKEHAILTAENNGEYVHIAMPIEIDS